MYKISKHLLAWLNAVSLVLLCLYASVMIPSLGMWFYRWQFAANDTSAVIGASPEELLRVTRHMLDYLLGHEPYIQIEALVHNELRPFFNQREILHMIDVYDLFAMGRLLRNVAASTLVASTAVLFVMRAPLLETLARAYRTSCILFILAIIAIAIPYVIDFHAAFIVFHEIFFDNDLWILDPATDLLINLVPLPFFITIGAVIGALFLTSLIIITTLSHAYLRMIPRPIRGPKLP